MIKDEFYFDVFPTSNSELSFCIAVLLILASQRIEVLIAEWFDNEELKAWLSQDVTVKRGATPTMVEWAILSWVAGNPFSSLTDPTKYWKEASLHYYWIQLSTYKILGAYFGEGGPSSLVVLWHLQPSFHNNTLFHVDSLCSVLERKKASKVTAPPKNAFLLTPLGFLSSAPKFGFLCISKKIELVTSLVRLWQLGLHLTDWLVYQYIVFCISDTKANTKYRTKSFVFSGLIWSEIKQLWDVGLRDYIADMWNVVDFVTNSLYVATIALRLVAYYKVKKVH